MPKVIEVIESETARGAGTELDRCRTVTQYHTLNGKLLAEKDPELEGGRSLWRDGDFFRRTGPWYVHGTVDWHDGIFRDGQMVEGSFDYQGQPKDC